VFGRELESNHCGVLLRFYSEIPSKIGPITVDFQLDVTAMTGLQSLLTAREVAFRQK
jgi:hypothetical protein